jgi:hypothetical protein
MWKYLIGLVVLFTLGGLGMADNIVNGENVYSGAGTIATASTVATTTVSGGEILVGRDLFTSTTSAPGGLSLNSVKTNEDSSGTSLPAYSSGVTMNTAGQVALATNVQKINEKGAIAGSGSESLYANTQGFVANLNSNQGEQGKASAALNFGEGTYTTTSGVFANADLKHNLDGTVKVGTINEGVTGIDTATGMITAGLKVDTDMKEQGGHILFIGSNLNMNSYEGATVLGGYSANYDYNLNQFSKHV